LRQRARTIFEDTDRAEAALQGMVPYERFLLRVQPITLLQSFDGANAAALPQRTSNRSAPARYRQAPRACAADALLAADMSSGLPAIVMDHVDERRRGSAITA
jgi:hypothetical protein